MAENELKPCPFCGESDYLSQKETEQKDIHIWCSFCTMQWISLGNWQNAFCWKQIDRLKQENALLKSKLSEGVVVVEKLTAQLAERENEIEDLRLRMKAASLAVVGFLEAAIPECTGGKE